MSVVGLDVGALTSKVGIVKNKGIEVAFNEVSNRETPSMVGFGANERALGEAAKTQYMMNWKNTVTGIKHLLGRKFDDPDLPEELQHHYWEAVADEAGNLACKVNKGGNELVVRPESVMASLLGKLKESAANALGIKVSDCVIAVPGYFSQAQRMAMLDAAKIADLNCLRLINELTAIALQWGFYKKDLDEKTPTNVMFVDMGASSFSVGVAACTKDSVKMLGTAYDPTLGGRDFDKVLLDHFTKEFSSKVDIASSKKATLRLLTACEKMKRVLSTNAVANINVECILNDVDVSGQLERDAYLELCAPLLARIAGPIQAAMEMAGITSAELAVVEIVGSGLRIPAVREAIEAAAGVAVSNTMNNSEAVARGCALACAQLSPVIRLRDFKVEDVNAIPVGMSWQNRETGDTDSVEVFSVGNTVPSSKKLTFYRSAEFEINAQYLDSPALRAGVDRNLGTFVVTNLPQRDYDVKIYVRARLDPSGLLQIPSAQAVEDIEVEVEEKVEAAGGSADAAEGGDTPMTEAAAEAADSDAAGGDADGDTPMTDATEGDAGKAAGDADAAAADGADGEEKTVKKTKKKTTKTELTVVSTSSGMSDTELMHAMELEAQFALEDRIIRETADARNNLESYVYDMRNKISTRGEYGEYVEDATREKFSADLDGMEDWLYSDEGEEAKKKEYESQLAKLETVGAPIVKRANEAKDRPEAVADLDAAVAKANQFVASTDAKYEHIDAETRAPAAAKATEVNAWLRPLLEATAAAPKHEDPKVTAAEIRSKTAELENLLRPIMNTPKPKPKVEEPAADAAADAAAPAADGDAPATEGAADADAADAAAPEEPKVPEPMELDAEA